MLGFDGQHRGQPETDFFTCSIADIRFAKMLVWRTFLLHNNLGKIRFFRRPFWWPILKWKWSQRCFSSSLAVQTQCLQKCLFGGLTRLQMTKRLELFDSKELPAIALRPSDEAWQCIWHLFGAWPRRSIMSIL